MCMRACVHGYEHMCVASIGPYTHARAHTERERERERETHRKRERERERERDTHTHTHTHDTKQTKNLLTTNKATYHTN